MANDKPSGLKPPGLEEAQAPFVTVDAVPIAIPAVVRPKTGGPKRQPPVELPDLSPTEFGQLRSFGRRIMYQNHETRRRLQRIGMNVVPSNFYSEIPTLDELDASFEFAEDQPFLQPFMDPGKVAAEFDALVPFASDFDPPVDEPADDLAYYWGNPAFKSADGMVYWSMIRKLRPTNVVEFGSGYSSRVATQALRANGHGRLRCLEPFPKDWLHRLDCELDEVRAQDVSAERLNDLLVDGDILFIDSTHTVKAGSDCLHIYLRLLPKLRRDVTVHVHDIYLPYPLPKRSSAETQIYWTEQYLLLALMIDNPRCRYLLSNNYGRHVAPDAMRRLMHARQPIGGASWWFEWNGA